MIFTACTKYTLSSTLIQKKTQPIQLVDLMNFINRKLTNNLITNTNNLKLYIKSITILIKYNGINNL